MTDQRSIVEAAICQLKKGLGHLHSYKPFDLIKTLSTASMMEVDPQEELYFSSQLLLVHTIV